jgi:N-methylhydantoinase A/oxoprolinase/acetone carboxylase beta subunit
MWLMSPCADHIRELTEMKGHETRKHTLACFGGAGPQHACAIARALGMNEVIIHRYCGILSAYGMGLADVVEEARSHMLPCMVLSLCLRCQNVLRF